MEIKSIDMNAFDAVYDAYAEKVYRISLYYSKDHHAAEDITQMVFMKWYTCRENVNVDRVEAWIKATAKHGCIIRVATDITLNIGRMLQRIESIVYLVKRCRPNIWRRW